MRPGGLHDCAMAGCMAHQHERAICRLHYGGHPGVGEGTHVIDERGARSQGRARHLRLRRVDGDGCLSIDATDGCEDGKDAAQLFLRVDRLVPRAGRFPTYVQDVGPLPQEVADVILQGMAGRKEPTVAETVRRGVHDGHHQGAPKRHPCSACEVQFSHGSGASPRARARCAW